MKEEGGNYWREEERTEEEGKGGRKDWRGKQKVRSGGEKKGMGRERMERWKEENKSYLLGKVFLDCLVLWR